MSIRAAVMTAPEQPLEVWDLDEPDVEDGGVVLETIASEVCGTDVHLFHGRLAGVPYPIIPGHVSVGRVLEARNVRHDALGASLSVGDVVTFFDVHEICGNCWFCLVSKQPNRCPRRKVYGITYSAHDGLLGGWAERIYLRPGVRIVKVSEPLTADDVIGGGCGLFTGFGAVHRAGIEMGDTVVVQGAGPVGLSAAVFAALRGAGFVAVIGDPMERLDLAVKLGADLVLPLGDSSIEERREKVLAITMGRGADVVIEASGNPRAVEEAFGIVRDGGTYVIAGHYTDAGTATVNPHVDINRKHLNIRGQWGTEFGFLPRALSLLAKHVDRLPFASIIGGRYGLHEAQGALDDVGELRVTKAVIVP